MYIIYHIHTMCVFTQRVQRPESRLECLKIKISVSNHIFTESEYILSNLNSAQLI